MKLCYNPCKYWCFGIVFFLKNSYVWLQWLGFEGKHAMFCIRGFNYQPLIRDMPVFQQFLTKSTNLCFLLFLLFTSLLNLCILQPLCSYIWEILPFSLQKWFRGYFAKGIWWNFTYFSTKIIHFMYYVLSNHCIKYNFMPIVCLLSKLIILWHFHFKMSNSGLHVMPSIYVQ